MGCVKEAGGAEAGGGTWGRLWQAGMRECQSRLVGRLRLGGEQAGVSGEGCWEPGKGGTGQMEVRGGRQKGTGL